MALLLVLSATAGCDAGPAPDAADDQATGGNGATMQLSQSDNPFAGHDLYVWPDSKAAAAAAAEVDPSRETTLTALAEVPTAIWLTPEEHPPGQLGGFVTEVVADATGRGEIPVFVLYGIPNRDCSGGFSAGGLTAEQYAGWVQEFRDAAGRQAVAILEPDAIAAARDCGIVAERRQLLSQAIGILADGPATYVDAGHSGWQDAGWMAQQLSAVGVHAVRGFSVNVAAYGADQDEMAYAQQVADSLGGSAFVIDTGRNGFGSTGEWCNPAGRAVGQQPAAVEDGSDLDAHLWIKPPGESDGTCAGGPPAGIFWPDRAIELAVNAGYPAG